MCRIVVWLLVIFLGVVAGAGCNGSPVGTARPGQTVEMDGLEISLEVPKRNLVGGERFNVLITARNKTDEPMEISARSGAPVFVRVFRYTGLTWREVKHYPQAAIMVMSPWTLPARGQRTFAMNLTVEPDWPTGELLRITGELNGRDEVSPGVTVHVSLPARSPGEPDPSR